MSPLCLPEYALLNFPQHHWPSSHFHPTKVTFLRVLLIQCHIKVSLITDFYSEGDCSTVKGFFIFSSSQFQCSSHNKRVRSDQSCCHCHCCCWGQFQPNLTTKHTESSVISHIVICFCSFYSTHLLLFSLFRNGCILDILYSGKKWWRIVIEVSG